MALVIATVMMASNIAPAFASGSDYSVKTQDYLNKLDVKPAKPADGETAEKLIENPAQPEIYTLRTDYKVQRGEKYRIDYQPYVASVGENATDEEKKKVNKKIDLPDLAGYEKPDGEDFFKDTYDYIVDEAKKGEKTGDEKYGLRYRAKRGFKYRAKSTKIKIKHVFQDLEDFSKYTNLNGSVGEIGELISTQKGNTGSTMEVIPLPESNPNRKGFVPERKSITMQVPENAEDFILEYRYNRAHYDVDFDTAGGTELPARTLYYGQVIPKIADADIPTKVGGEFQGWKPSVDLITSNGKTYKANEIIKDGTGEAIKNLAANLTMPPSKVTFTAVWKDKEKADYAVQFWAEKADHADGASLADKYDFIGTHVYKDQAIGARPDLENEPVEGIVFPDLDQDRLDKIWANKSFFNNSYPYLNKFYVYNKDLTHDQNKDPKNVKLVKSVDATGRTVYNIYYDRQVYDLYFTKSNVSGSAFYPEISKDGKEVGKEGNPYHFKARFNQRMVGLWPDDVKEVKGFDEGKYSLGWLPNLKTPKHYYRDTPPYRLSANLFIDCPDLEKQGGYVSEIDLGNGQTKPASITDLSFGLDQSDRTMPHHIDFWLDDFDGNQVIDYDLYTIKSDTDNSEYKDFLPPDLQGFTPKEKGGRGSEFKEDSDLDDLNDEREEITPFPEVYSKELDESGDPKQKGKLYFMKNFPGDEKEFEQNGYLKFEYSRNKYPLRFNYDPSTIKGDNEFGPTNSLQTFYEFPLKALSPEADTEKSYKTENPKNILDNPEKLQELGLTDLVFTDPKDGKLKVKRPEGLSDQMAFKGWALDPAGTKLVRDNGSEKMPSHPVNLYAKWGEPDYKWKVTFDPNGGNLRNIKEENLTTERKKIKEGDIGQEETKTYPIKEANEGDKQIFTVFQRQKLVEPNSKPTRKGYDFLGWEVIRYKKNQKGDYTDKIDNSYRENYKVPELYSFGNDVVAPVYLKAIWVPNNRVDVKVEHYFLDNDFNLDKSINPNPDEDTLEEKRAKYLVAATGDRQGEKYILATNNELEEKLTGELKNTYEQYNKRVGLKNSFFQTFEVEPAQILNTETNQLEDNPKVADNVFKFFYKPYRQREYKVNYVDERAKAELAKVTSDGDRKAIIEKYSIVDQEVVTNGNRYYDARNYRPIPGWVLAKDEKPQQQLFFDVEDKTNKFLGINGTGKDEITFYYKDVRIIEVPKGAPVPDGYVRVTFKADKGGSFGKDDKGNDITELNYDVIKGLKSDHLPVPKVLQVGETKEAGKYYITPDDGKRFSKWDEKPLLNADTEIKKDEKDYYVFTAKFDWPGIEAKELVTTESFNDPENNWTNDFAPTIEKLKKQVVYKEEDGTEKPLPAGAIVTIVDNQGNALTDDYVYKQVKELGRPDKDEVVRTINFKAEVKFKDGKNTKKLEIPVKIYKNVYEALTGTEKPHFLSQAEEGELKDITGKYVKVIVAPTGDMDAKDNKVYYVNKKAWVSIPEAKPNGSTTFINWTADKVGQNEDGKFYFEKRHKFTKATVISPRESEDVAEQTDPNKKPDVPDSYVKVIVKTTDKATEPFKKTFWVNPTKEVTIPVIDPTGKTDQDVTIPIFGRKKASYDFKKWQIVQTGEADDKLKDEGPTKIDLAKHKYTDKVTVIEASYSQKIAWFDILKPTETKELHTPQGKEITNDDLIKQITPQKDKEIESIEIVSKPDGKTVGKSKAKVIIKYKDGSTQGTNDNPIVIPVEVHENIIPAGPNGEKPEKALENYVKVSFKAGEGGKLGKTLSGIFTYYVSPEVEVDMTKTAENIEKLAGTGYHVKDENWTNKDNKTLKGTFKDQETVFVFKFAKSEDIVEKTNDPNQVIPEGYVKVTFKADKNGKLAGDKKEITYYVNPQAGIKLKVLGKNEQVADKELAVPEAIADKDYEFTKWVEDLDLENPITGDRKYVAKFTKDEVSLSYEIGEDAKGKAPETVTTSKGTKVRLASDKGISKKDHTFKGWKIGDEIYQAGDEITLKEKTTTATAQWEKDADVIPYDPENPIAKPQGYVRVSFEADDGLTLTNVKNYYVKKNAGIKIGDKTIVKPTAKAKTGYEFEAWSPKDQEEIKSEDIVVKATSNPYEDTIEKIDKNTKKPDGYVEVKFVAGEHGQLEKDGSKIEEKTYYVNPYKYVKLIPPATKGDTGYEFGAWDKLVTGYDIYKAPSTTITANFNEIKAVIPKTDDSKKQEGYVEVNFEIKGDGGKIVAGQPTTHYVDPTREVTINPPSTQAEIGYVFDKWDPDTISKAKKYPQKTTVKGTFKALEALIPSTNDKGQPNPKPQGYVTVTFKADINGSLKGETKYYVNPTKEVDLTNDANNIKKIANTGYTSDGGSWKDADKEATLKATFNEDTEFVYNFKGLADVIPKTRNDDKEKPQGYIEVSFDTTDKGTIEDSQETTKVVYVNPDKAVVLEGYAPRVSPKTGYTFANWDTSINKAIQYKDKDKIKATYTDLENISTTEKSGFVKVIFKEGEHGSLEGTRKYWIKPNTEVEIPAPIVKANIGYSFEKWDKNLKVKLKADSADYEITAKYKKLDDIIPDDGKTEKPTDYITITFQADSNGILRGITRYFVNPNKEVDLTQKANNIEKIAKVGYTSDEGKWKDGDEEATLNASFSKDKTFIYNFTPYEDIIPSENIAKKPSGYVKVTFKADENGKLAGDKKEITYYVNPQAGIKLVDGQAGEKELQVPNTKPAENYKFIKWFEAIDKDTTITGNREYVAIFGKTEVSLSYDLNGGIGTAPETKTVPYGTSLRLATDEGISKTDAKFIGWDIDGTIYKPGAEITLTKDQKATAKWTDDEKIISYNPKDPITRPEGYVRVTFKADKGLSLTEEKAYYVKADKGLTLKAIKDSQGFGYPAYTEETGYSFDKWDKAESTVIKTDIELTAKARESYDVVPKTKDDDSEKPDGYVKVTFVAGVNGKLGNETNTFFVNPTKYVKLSPPSTQADTGYIFAGWSMDASQNNNYTKDTTIKASFNPIDSVIPKTKDDESEKPAGFVTVSFEIEGKGGKIVDGQTTTYYVKPNTEVTIPQPQTKAEIGYDFDKWDTDTKTGREYKDQVTTIKGSFKALPAYIPAKDKDEKDKPNGYIRIVFRADENGKLQENNSEIDQKVYYVNPNATIDYAKDLTQGIEKVANKGYTAEGGNWKDETGLLSKLFSKDKLFIYHFKEAKNVIPDEKGEPIPKGFVKVSLVPTDKAKDPTEKSYWVNPKEEVEIPFDNPVGKTADDKDHKGYTTTYTFKEWKVVKGSLATYKDKVKGQFKEETVLEATYTEKTSGKGYDLTPAVKAKKDTITPQGNTPKPEELIVNTPGQGKDPLPEGTKISYEKDGEPDTKKPGNPTAKVKIEYPNGKTVVIEVPIKVVDHIVPQEGSDKPEVPSNYVKVVIDTTNKATENTYFVKTYWVNPEAEVSFPVKAPSGKSEEIDGVTSKYEFSSWKLEASGKDYGSHIKDTFTAKESKIVATYKTDKNIEPEGNDGLLIPEDENPDPRDFIKNDYDDKNPDKKDMLPPGTKFTFKEGKEPKTDSPHEGKTTIVVEYPNGEKKEIEVGYKVVGKVVEQEGKENPDVPKDYVKVSLIPTDKSEDQEKIYWVRPRVEVTIPDYEVKGKDKWIFKDWDKKLTDVFMRDTEIRAIYAMETLKTSGDIIVTEKDKQPEVGEYRKRIQIQEGEEARDLTDKDKIEYEKPDVSTLGDHPVKVKVKLEDGTELETTVIVRVVDTIYKLDKDHPEKNENIPDNYIQVIVVPTTDNEDSEEHYYAVKISENDEDIRKIDLPKIKAVEGKTFLGWEVRKGTSKYESYDKEGEAFSEPVNIIRAKFVDDVVIQTGKEKPEVPDNYVKVVVDRTDYARKPRKTIYWVNPDKEVDLGEVDPSAKDGYSFKGWKLSEKKKEEDKDFDDVSSNFDLEGKKHKYEAFETHIEAVFEKIKTPSPSPVPGQTPGPNPGGGSPQDDGKKDHDDKNQNPSGGKPQGGQGGQGDQKGDTENKETDGKSETTSENTNPPSSGSNDGKVKGGDGENTSQAQPSGSDEDDTKIVTRRQPQTTGNGSNKRVFSKVKTGVRSNLGVYLTIITISAIGYVLSKKK